MNSAGGWVGVLGYSISKEPSCTYNWLIAQYGGSDVVVVCNGGDGSGQISKARTLKTIYDWQASREPESSTDQDYSWKRIYKLFRYHGTYHQVDFIIYLKLNNINNSISLLRHYRKLPSRANWRYRTKSLYYSVKHILIWIAYVSVRGQRIPPPFKYSSVLILNTMLIIMEAADGLAPYAWGYQQEHWWLKS